MSLPPDLHARLLAACYESVAEPPRLLDALRLMSESLGCDLATLRCWDRRAYWGCAIHAHQQPAGWHLQREDAAVPSAELRALTTQLTPGHWVLLDRVSGATTQRRRRTLAVRVPSLRGAEALFSLHRPGLDVHNSAQLSAQAQPMLVLMRPALEAMTQMRQLTTRLHHADRLLDAVRLPLLLLDGSARVLSGNRQGLALVRRAEGARGKGRGCAIDGVSASALLSSVRRACGIGGSAAGTSLALDAPDHAAGRLLVLPAPQSHAPASAAMALLVLLVPGMPVSPPMQMLGQLFALTPAEARLAQLILEGQSPADVAGRLNVSLTTVRSQLSAVLRKTGASKQSELVRRLSPLMVVEAATRAG